MNKQKDIRWFLHSNNVGLFGLIETRVRSCSINKVHQGLGLHWAIVNNNCCLEGGRIWLIWNAIHYNVEVLNKVAQVINARVTFLPTGEVWWLSLVYGFNRLAKRVTLLQALTHMKTMDTGPWVVMGDFNTVLAMNERISSEVSDAEVRDFQQCIDECEIRDIPAHGAYYTWNNKHEAGDMVFSRIDRAMVNDEWLLQFQDTITMFHPKGLFDHCPCTMVLNFEGGYRKGSFKYFNMWGKDYKFIPVVKRIWEQQVAGFKMFQFVKKLKAFKKPLKDLNHSSYSNIETTTKVALMLLHNAQRKLHLDPSNFSLQQEAHNATLVYQEKLSCSES
ncbi:uncharacterized protein LOC141632943 [Silene latifolia]|uniref:uncharacterized protein LOC141632943 n=1 Tax=Silene latifolia TaxID=37657 RepID=UPI003D76F773